jgi:hypothetical protein
MKRVSSQASALVRKSREIANGMLEFGLAFHQLGQRVRVGHWGINYN